MSSSSDNFKGIWQQARNNFNIKKQLRSSQRQVLDFIAIDVSSLETRGKVLKLREWCLRLSSRIY